jgi:hypothetical protein
MSLEMYVFLGAALGFILGSFVGSWLFRHRITDSATRLHLRRHKNLFRRLRKLAKRHPRNYFRRPPYVHDVPENIKDRIRNPYFGRLFDL